MAKKRTHDKEKSVTISMDHPAARIGLGVMLWLLVLLLVFGAFDRAGLIGNSLEAGFEKVFGILGTALLALLLTGFGLHLVLYRRSHRTMLWPTLYAVLFICGTLGTFGATGMALELTGTTGSGIANLAASLFGGYVSVIVLIVVALGGGLLLLEHYFSFVSNLFTETEDEETSGDTVRVRSGDEVSELALDDEYPETEDETPKKELTITGVSKRKDKTEDTLEIIEPSDRRILGAYTPPSLSLLSKSKGTPNVGDIKERAAAIQRTLDNFGITVHMDEVAVGPTITRYALKPARGVKLSKIVSLQNNLELDLAAHIRIEAPIPGKSLVGIEIPNKSKSTVGLRDVFSDPAFANSDKPLLFSLGKSVTGDTKFANLAKLPHLMIAGATGAGKSVTVHNIIVSLLYRNGPDMVRFIMVDPKRVELTLYNKIPHLLTPVIKDAKKAILAFKWAVKEMERRYDVLEGFSVRDIGSYHTNIVEPAYEKIQGVDPEDVDQADLPERMPYIVIVIDEMADLMQAYPRELESAIVRLAQMSRAVGIHLILSTQRPSVNVITGLIKANVPGRIALRVSSQVDSRTILDFSGAEKLLGAGDMLFTGGDVERIVRLQCPFIPEKEVKSVVKHIIKHNSDYLIDEIELPDTMDGGNTLAGGSLGDEEDELYPEARELVIHAGKGSTSYIQRKLRVGYSRAARLMDMLEEQGVVGPPDGSKPREVLVGPEETLEDDELYDED